MRSESQEEKKRDKREAVKEKVEKERKII